MRFFRRIDCAIRLLARLIVSLCLTALLAGCDSYRESFRYRLAVEVYVDGVPRRAVTVVEFVVREAGEWTHGFDGGKGGGGVSQGEGFVIDLGPGRRPLVGTLRLGPSGAAESFGVRALFQAYEITPTKTVDGRNDSIRKLKAFADTGPRKISVDDLPFLVTFTDPANPKSVVEVDRYDLADTLGPGVSWAPSPSKSPTTPSPMG